MRELASSRDGPVHEFRLALFTNLLDVVLDNFGE
jgi:hypothetical protein